MENLITKTGMKMDAPFPEGMLKHIDNFLIDNWWIPNNQDVYQEVFDSELFFPLQRQAELAVMMRTARSVNPVTVFEIGSDKGGGLYHWCRSLAKTVRRVIACEIRGTPYRHAFKKAFPNIEFLWLDGLSSYAPATVEIVRSWLQTPGSVGAGVIDCLFIDGDKLKFIDDYNAYLPLMNNDRGLVFMHDIVDHEPRKAFNKVAISGKYNCSTITDTTDSTVALQRASLGIPPASPHEAWLRHWAGRSCGVGVINIGVKSIGVGGGVGTVK